MTIAEDTSPPLAVGRTGTQNENFVGTQYNGLDNSTGSEPDCHDEMPTVAAPKPMRALAASAASSAALSYEYHRLTRPSITPTAPDEDLHEKPLCMFIEGCDTGSQLRKAISHLFGRNKTCTLKIPKVVWVYYCRKHYQRVRYHYPKTYPATQLKLVEKQIERLKTWSDRNQARGKGPYINSWTLSLRKRERKRLQADGRSHGEEEKSSARGTGYSPTWIIEELGEVYDTERVFKIVERLRKEIENDTLAQVPEIEFLPDIVGDDEDKGATKTTSQRRRNNRSACVTKTSKRKAPNSQVILQPNPMYHDVGYASYIHDGRMRC